MYPNAPIVLMAVEVRHSLCQPLERKQVAQVSAEVTQLLPLPSELTEVSVTVQAGPSEPPVQQQVVAMFPRWMSRDKRTSLTMRPDSFVIETTNYGSYDRVRELLEAALRLRQTVEKPGGVERIGLRYIDEIRAPLVNDVPDWKEWVEPALLGPLDIGGDLGLVPAVNEGVTVFSHGTSSALVLRYGAQNDYVVPSTSELRRPLPPPGPLFKLDIDSFWQAGDEIPEFDTDQVLAQADSLHEPVRGVFEDLITDRLREEVLRND